jgi:hypothetical protein
MKQNASPVSVSMPKTEPDKFELQRKKIDNKAIVGGIIAVAIILFALIKRKTIAKWFKKKPPTDEIPPKPPINPTKIEFPEFKGNIQSAEEKKAYIDSVIKYAKHTDRDLQLKTIKAVSEYGTWEDLEKIGYHIGSRDDEIARALANTVAKIGRPDDAFYLTGSILPSDHSFSTETYLDITKAIKKLGLASEEYKYVIRLFDKVSKDSNDELAKELVEALSKWPNKDSIRRLKEYENHDNPVVRDSVKKIIENINNNSNN